MFELGHPGHTPADTASLRSRLAQGLAPILASTQARVTMAVHALDGTPLFERDASTAMPSASLIKVPILLLLLEQTAAGQWPLDHMLPLEHIERVGGTGILKQLPSVRSLPLEELARLMIVLSDNVATNALIDWLGLASVTPWCQRAGLPQTRLERHMMDAQARDAGRDNWTSAADACTALLWLLRDGSLPAPLRQLGLQMLADQREQSHFGAALPAHAKLANKTGQLHGLRHDAGILSAGGQSVVLAVLADGFTDPRTSMTLSGGDGAALLAQLARAVALALPAP